MLMSEVRTIRISSACLVKSMPQRPAPPVDPELLPIMYLGGVNSDGNTSSNYSRACRFQVVAIINSFCWNARSDPRHDRCTNHSAEFQYIVDQSQALQKVCPGVLTQMYLNSMMNFWWYLLWDMLVQNN